MNYDWELCEGKNKPHLIAAHSITAAAGGRDEGRQALLQRHGPARGPPPPLSLPGAGWSQPPPPPLARHVPSLWPGCGSGEGLLLV